jgi:hypothetical protein
VDILVPKGHISQKKKKSGIQDNLPSQGIGPSFDTIHFAYLSLNSNRIKIMLRMMVIGNSCGS